MNWLTNFIRPRIQSLVEAKEVPDNLWQQCPSCEGMLFHRDLEKNNKVCYHCGHHLRITVKERLALMFDDGEYENIPLPKVAYDPLKFKDRKKYADRIKDSRGKTGLKEAITVAQGIIGGQPVVIAAFNFSFMGGSMGAGVGEAIVMAAEKAVETNSAFIAIPSSGGARMQEGMLSLVQMPRTIIAVEMVKEAKLPYIVLLTDPTTGGVSASFAMVGDIHLAEPGSTIGFAGRRVIEETVRETLPDDFQTAEYLKEHGIVDMVVPREELKETISKLLNFLMTGGSTDGGSKKTKGKSKKTNGKTAPESPAEESSAQAAETAKAAQTAATAGIQKKSASLVKTKKKSLKKAIRA